MVDITPVGCGMLVMQVLRCIWVFHQWWCTRCVSVSGADAAAGGQDGGARNETGIAAIDGAGVGSHVQVGPAA